MTSADVWNGPTTFTSRDGDTKANYPSTIRDQEGSIYSLTDDYTFLSLEEQYNKNDRPSQIRNDGVYLHPSLIRWVLMKQ